MSSDFQPLQGMHDITGDEIAHWQWLEQQARSLFYRFGYSELRTPLLERQALFLHSLGDTTDIVQKEMYALEDRGGRSLALRPEGTAGVMRHLASLGEEGQQMQCYYIGPMFRCERPQAGRKRQFHQMGVESAGEANPLADAAVIVLQLELLKAWGLENIKIRVGTRGAASDQQTIRDGLRTAFAEKRDQFCEDCQRRIDENVLRVLDCKNEACQALLRTLPTPADFLSAEAKAYHEAVLSALNDMDI
jgi:histidyl-tRNA synthetase